MIYPQLSSGDFFFPLTVHAKTRILRRMHLIDGKTLAARLREEAKSEVASIGYAPKLGVLLIGDDPASQLYVSLKKKAAEDVGIRIEIVTLPASVPDETIIRHIETWNGDADVNAILVQLPLPEGHDTDRVIAAMDPAKDVDGFHPKTASIPPVHEGILRLINETPLALNGAQATILANSDIFANPLQRLFALAGAASRVMNPDAIDRAWLATSDVVVVAVGRANFLNPTMTKRDAVIIDVGTNKTPEGKTCGDADFASYESRDVWITPVPGGVGPMTIAMLLKNVIRMAATSPPTPSPS